jgi:GAF domain-containing protein
VSDPSTDPLEIHAGLPRRSREAELLRLLIEVCAQFVGAAEGSLLLLERGAEEPESLVFAMTAGSRESEQALLGQRVPLGEGIVGLAAVTHEVQIGMPSYPGVEQARRQGEAPGQPSSVIAAPMLADGDLVGVITAVHFEPARRFSPADALLYGRVATIAGLLLDQGRRLAALGEGSPR